MGSVASPRESCLRTHSWTIEIQKGLIMRLCYIHYPSLNFSHVMCCLALKLDIIGIQTIQGILSEHSNFPGPVNCCWMPWTNCLNRKDRPSIRFENSNFAIMPFDVENALSWLSTKFHLNVIVEATLEPPATFSIPAHFRDLGGCW